MTYDTLGRLATAQDGLTTKTLTYGYDAAGNRVSLTYDGLTTAYGYDADRRLASLTDPTGEVTTMTYDAAGNRTQLAQGNGVLTTTTFDAVNRPTQISSPIQSFGYSYDLAGNPEAKTFADGTSEQYSYDASNELNGYTRPDGSSMTYVYSFGSILSRLPSSGGSASSTLNSFNQTTALSGTTSYSYTFDADGNRLTQGAQPPGSPKPPLQTTTYTWNDDDRMSGVTLPSTATNSYGYDANGIRVSKRDSSGNVNYLVDPQTQSILATYDAVAGTRLATYNQNPKKIDEIVSYQVNGLKYYPHADMLGTVYAVSDVTAKAIATWTYDVWGARTQTSGALSYQFGFTGREHDVDTGLIYSRQRYYDPNVGCWLAPDRLGMPNGPDRYEYAEDMPTLMVDPSGLLTQVIIWSPAQGLGSSSFGHVSVDINGTTYSFGPGGMWIGSTSAYLDRNAWRSGVGILLDISSEQEAELQLSMQTWSSSYNALTNNCTAPIKSGLLDVSIDLQDSSVFPLALADALMSDAIGEAYYPATESQP